MATREVSNSTRTVERWTNEGTPGYYSGSPLTKQRDLTTQEATDLAAMDTANTQTANGDTIRTQAAAALTTNRTDQTTNSTYIALASPSTAQNTAEIKALAQQMNRSLDQRNKIIRLLLNQLDGTN